MKRKIYISHLFPDEDLSKLLINNSVGIETINFGIGYVLDGKDNGIEEYLKKMDKLLKDRSISVHGPFLDLSPSSFDSLIREATKTRYNQAYSVAKRIGADRIVFHSCYYDNIYYREGYLQKSIEFWNEFFEDKDDDIKIHIENVFDKEPSHLIEIIDKVKNKNLSVCLDIGHVNCYSDLSIELWLKKLGERIGHIHIHNNYGTKDTHSGLNNGNIDINKVLTLIDDFCKDATITIEVNNSNEVYDLLDLLIKRYNI